MTTGLLERVRFLGGNGGDPSGEEPTTELPPLDLGPGALEPDPQPAPETRKKTKAETSAKTAARQPRAGGKFVSTKAQTQQLSDELEMWLRMLAGVWSMSDEHCAGVLNETSAKIAADLARLGARSEWVMNYFTETSMLGDFMQLIIHLSPLLRAVYAHHVKAQPSESEYEPVPVADPAPVDLGQYGPWRP